MDALSQRTLNVLQAKLRALDEANKRGENVYLDYKRARFGFAKSLIVHEIIESNLLLGAAKRLNIPFAYEELGRSTRSLFEWLRRQADAKGDEIEVSELISGVLADFPRFQTEVQRELLYGEFTEPELVLRIPGSFFGVFRTILCMQLTLLEQPTVLSYLEAVRTLPGEDWKTLMTHSPKASDIALAADSEELSSEAVFYGFLFMASTMARLNSVIGPKPTAEEYADSATLLEYVRSALDWRLDFKSSASFQRFEDIKRTIATEIARELPYRAAELFEDEFEQLLNGAFNLEIA